MTADHDPSPPPSTDAAPDTGAASGTDTGAASDLAPGSEAACHDLLRHLAGRAPDDLLPSARTWLAEGRVVDVARAVTVAALTYRVPLREQDIPVLASLLSTGGADPTVLAEAEVVVSEVPPPFVFGERPDDAPDAGSADAAAVAAASGTSSASAGRAGKSRAGKGRAKKGSTTANRSTKGTTTITTGSGAGPVRGLWRSWRRPADGSPWPPPRPVYIVEVATLESRVATAALVGQALRDAGDPTPQVECHATGEDLPTYVRMALTDGSLLWAASPDREILVADVFDRIDDDGEPAFDDDHPRIDDIAERERLAAYLNSGAALLTTPMGTIDILAPERGPVVPLTFRTDGTWVWTDALTYYLVEYGIRPVPELLAHLAEAGTDHPQIDGVDVYRAMVAITG
ncbi:MAG: hypothetical protein ACRCYX_16480 [Dermatophilaceae bacterium]